MRAAGVLGFVLFGVGCGGANDESPPAGPGDATGGSSGVAGNTAAPASGHDAGAGGPAGGSGGTARGSGGGAGAAGGADAGTGGGGGAGGDATTPPAHTVGNCDGLGPVGTWEEVTPSAITPWTNDAGSFYRPAIFGLDPQNAGTAYLGTDSYNDGHSKGLFKTTDCAATWTHVSTGRNGDAIDGGRNWAFAIDPSNSQILYTNSGYYKLGLFKSTNGGVDWDDVTPTGDGAPGFVKSLRMDPDDPKHLLMSWHSGCGPWSDHIGCFAESKDAGATWKEHWGTPSWPEQVEVWFLHGDSWIIASSGIQLTTDGGVTWKTVSGSGAGGHSAGGLYRAKDGSYYLGTQDGVLRGSQDGTTWNLVPGTGSWGLFVTGSDTDLYLATSGGFKTAKVSDGTKWTDMPPGSPQSCFDGVAYDPDHHLLYASCLDQGFWRMRTQ